MDHHSQLSVVILSTSLPETMAVHGELFVHDLFERRAPYHAINHVSDDHSSILLPVTAYLAYVKYTIDTRRTERRR